MELANIPINKITESQIEHFFGCSGKGCAKRTAIFSLDKLHINEISTLPRMLDTLLPKLICGQIRIKNLENLNGVTN